jgi:hypothetical protein
MPRAKRIRIHTYMRTSIDRGINCPFSSNYHKKLTNLLSKCEGM